MAHVPPGQRDYPPEVEEGRAAAGVVWLLYLLAIPSANLLALVGLVVAYAVRGSSSGWVRAHFDSQIRLFWSVIVWFILLVVVSVVLLVSLIGIPLLIFTIPAAVVLFIWYAVKSVLGLIAVVQGRAP